MKSFIRAKYCIALYREASEKLILILRWWEMFVRLM